PLKDIQKINERLGVVEHFILQTDLRNRLVHAMRQCGDMERLVSKVPLKKINPRELLQLSRALRQVEIIRELCLQSGQPYLVRLADALNPCHYIADKIQKEIIENPPALATKGGFINAGVHTQLDELRSISSHGKEHLLKIQQEEAAATG